MLSSELISEHRHLTDVAWSLIERQNHVSQVAYLRLSERLSRIDARMAEIERSVPASALYAD